jgi:hypothetical protein
VQELLSLQVRAVWTQPVAVLQVSVVQALLSLQLSAVCVHAFAVQPSVVQASVSIHDVGTIGVYTHALLTHVSVVQMLLSLQSAAVVHTLQTPSAVSQVAGAVQTTGVYTQPVAGTHVSSVHRLLSLQVIGVCTQAAVDRSQESVVHALLSLQSVGQIIMLKLALKFRNGPSTMPLPFLPSPSQSFDIKLQTLLTRLVPHIPVPPAARGDGPNTAFCVQTSTTSMFALGPQLKSMWTPISPAATVKVIGAPVPQPGLPAAQPA